MDPMKEARPRITAETWKKPALCPLPDWLLPALGHTAGNGENGKANGYVEPEAVIRKGQRDVTLTSMAGSMRAKGFSEAAICSALLVENETRCIPCLSTDQIEKIARSVARYEPDPLANIILRNVTPQNGQNAHAANAAGNAPVALAAIERRPMSSLRRLGDAEKWHWQGIIPAELVTVFSALPKAGKTTLMTHLLRCCEAGAPFCGLGVRPARAVYVTEESETIWAERRDRLGLADHIEMVLRPFRSKPTFAEWRSFIDALTVSLKEKPADLVVIDTLAKLWPVHNENDASEVTASLQPLQEIAYRLRTTLLLVHHLRKSDGLEATQTRGSGAITASVDCIIEFRRYRPGDRKDRRRVLHCDARYDDRVDELVVELSADGRSYSARGDRQEAAIVEACPSIYDVLPVQPPGYTREQVIQAAWPAGSAPTKADLLAALNHGVEVGRWHREGDGKRGDPHRFWRDP
jgi:hypothetical protein